jgi:transcriptional regulator
VHDDVGWLSALVRRLTEKHESGNTPRWSVDDAPGSYISGQLRAIVGLEIAITRVEAKWKLSQNRSAADAEGVVTALQAGTPADQAVGEQMRRLPRR